MEVGTLLMHDFDIAYSHFSGSFDNHPNAWAKEFIMIFETALWVKESGFSRLHLGGGLTQSPKDTLLQWKAGFTDRLTPLWTYFCVRDIDAYNTLCDRKRAYERQTAGGEVAVRFPAPVSSLGGIHGLFRAQLFLLPRANLRW